MRAWRMLSDAKEVSTGMKGMKGIGKIPFIPFIPVEITGYSTRPGNRNSVIGNGVIGV
jgi:hypothetical protein